MKLPCTIAQQADGTWTVHHESADLGSIRVGAATKSEALDKMRGELRYRLELCPCSGESYQHLQIEIVADNRSRP